MTMTAFAIAARILNSFKQKKKNYRLTAINIFRVCYVSIVFIVCRRIAMGFSNQRTVFVLFDGGARCEDTSLVTAGSVLSIGFFSSSFHSNSINIYSQWMVSRFVHRNRHYHISIIFCNFILLLYTSISSTSRSVRFFFSL